MPSQLVVKGTSATYAKFVKYSVLLSLLLLLLGAGVLVKTHISAAHADESSTIRVSAPDPGYTPQGYVNPTNGVEEVTTVITNNQQDWASVSPSEVFVQPGQLQYITYSCDANKLNASERAVDFTQTIYETDYSVTPRTVTYTEVCDRS